jgi:hypothetical protein
MEQRSAADVEGPWVEPGLESGLILRCKRDWRVPIPELTNEILATFLRQRIALALVVPEARRRLAAGLDDDSELYDGELASALNQVTEAK